MKKLLSLISVLLCTVMLSTTAFAASTDPLALYKNYLKNAAKLTSADISISLKMSLINAYGLDIESEVLRNHYAVKMRMPGDNKLEMEIKSRDDDSDDISYMYYRNNYLYNEVLGYKRKEKLRPDKALTNYSVSLYTDLTDEVLKNAEFEMLDEGVKITYKMRVKDLPDTHAMASLKEAEEDEQVGFSSVTTRIIIGHDGMLKSGTNVLSMRIKDDYTHVDFKIVQAFKVNSVNAIASIPFPSDLGSYPEIGAW